MKILHCDPKSLAGLSGLDDDSRFGLHVKAAELSSLGNLSHGFVIVGFADEAGIRNVGGRTGAAEGPQALRQKLYRFTTGAPRLPVYDLGDLLPLGSIEETHRAGTLVTRRILESGHVPIVIGGGHDLGFPHALGLLEAREKRTAFVNCDAHLDLRPATNGITSGSPWFLLREHPLFSRTKSRIEEFGLQEHCNAHVLLDYARRHKFGLHWLREIRSRKPSVELQFKMLLTKLSSYESILVSFDIDCVQWSDAPGCSAPQTVGFTAAEAIAISQEAGRHKKVKSYGLFELSPALDPDGRTAALSAHCIMAFLKGKSVWTTGKNRDSGNPKKR